MKFLTLSCSHQRDSQSLKVSRYVFQFLKKEHESKLLDLHAENLPLWSPECICDEKISKQWSRIAKLLQESDGFVIVTPEYAGMATPCLKNFFLFTSSAEVGHKPALIISVSSGISGAYPVADLRMSGHKNNKICYIPDHIIVRYVKEVLNEQDSQNKSDDLTRERLSHGLAMLVAYSRAFFQLRKENKSLLETCFYGM